jgi:hypothetical protein
MGMLLKTESGILKLGGELNAELAGPSVGGGSSAPGGGQ